MGTIVGGLLILLARVVNVSMGTVRTLLGMRGQKRWATAIGFVESLIFILAISQVLQDVSNVWTVLGYCSGFAAGTWVGLVIEGKLALGYAIVRAISQDDGKDISTVWTLAWGTLAVSWLDAIRRRDDAFNREETVFLGAGCRCALASQRDPREHSLPGRPAAGRRGEGISIPDQRLAYQSGHLRHANGRAKWCPLAGHRLGTGFFILSKTLLRPAAFALISKRSAGSQGAAMGLSNSFMSLGRIAGPVWAGFVFDVNVNYPYLSGAAIMFIGFLVSLIWVSQGCAD